MYPTIPDALRDLPWEPPHTFMAVDEDLAAWERAGVVILPVPYEATVSYQGGTRNGPAAIVDASRYVETYDQELDGEPIEAGIATLPALHLTGAGPEAAVRELREAYDAVLDAAGDRLVIALGGEHSITSAPVLAHAERLKREGRRLSVLQMDAHGDLRPEYEGSPYSHAAVMARCVDDADLVQVGIRAVTSDERALIRGRESVTTIFADEMWEDDAWIERALEALGEDVYVTFDVDYFDPSILPATGTPEPGGGDWYRTLRLLRRVFEARNVVGADVVELAPKPGDASSDFVVAKLVYKMIGYRWAAGRGRG